ncbi:AAC(3) family N-acetyltransferase [Lentzea flaviverrucosa]|uniref:AAC(3) family N-acetyltransferase n=1 Tax=Lentzea flaviverrucosa TaxID=200379 RepID=UPI001160B362|nr:AAC(3) family N-acetyltransferase [Lentzea flaviverrucosa]
MRTQPSAMSAATAPTGCGRNAAVTVRVLRPWSSLLGAGHNRDSFRHHYSRIGAESAERGPARRQAVGAARCGVVEAVPFIDFARHRLAQLLRR